MDINDVKLSLVKYKFNKFDLSIPSIGTYSVEPSLISNVVIDKDFENLLFPYFEIDVLVPNSIYRAMKKNATDIYVSIDLQRGYFSAEQNTTNQSTPTFYSYIKETYYVLFKDTSPELDEDIQIMIEKETGTYGNLGIGEGSLVKLLLYNKKFYHNSGIIVNNILSNVTLMDAMIYVANEANLSNLLVSPPSSYKKYSEFTITPIPAIEQMRRLVNEYAFHKNGTTVFLDLVYGYILERVAKCTAFITNEIKTTYLYSDANVSAINNMKRGCYQNKTDKYNLINLPKNNVTFKSLAEINDKLVGNTYVAVDYNSGSISKQNSNAIQSTNSKGITNVIITKDNNKVSRLNTEIAQTSYIATFGCSYVDLEMLHPNKQFVFMLTDSKLKKYTGNYIISKMTCIFEKEGNYFIPHVTAEFKK